MLYNNSILQLCDYVYNSKMENIYNENLAIRIRSLSKPGANGCIEFTGVRNNGGYGLISVKLADNLYRMIPAHRALFMAVNRVVLPRDLFVCHACDNPACVNLAHLFTGSALDNTRDCINKNRRAKKHKRHSRVRKHSDEVIIAIKSETGKNADIAAKYGITPGYVSSLRSGKSKPLVKPVDCIRYYRNHPIGRS